MVYIKIKMKVLNMTVYLIHFDEPFKHFQHYLGYTSNLERRIKQHRSGNGARLIKAVQNAGISWSVVRTWEGGRKLESRLKRQHNSPRLCPICNIPEHEEEKGNESEFSTN